MAEQPVNLLLYDAAVSHQIGVLRLSNSVLRDLIYIADRAHADAARKLRSASTELQRQRLKGLLRSLEDLVSSAYAELARRLTAHMLDLATYEVDFQRRMVERWVPIDISFRTPTTTQVQAAVRSRPLQGRTLAEWSQALTAGARQRITDAVRIGFTEGETTDQIVRRITGTPSLRYADGALAQSRRGVESLVRTTVSHTAAVSRSLAYAANANLIKGERWVSTLDSRTTPICRARDGTVYPLGEGPRPPAHWGCRSTTTPVTKSWRELGIDQDELPPGTRASMDGQVPATETYQTWLRRQPAAFQDDVLGPTRGRLFRQGGLTLDKFVTRAGDELTLAQLRQRDADAFKRAGL